ncbi:MAG: ATP phosphoribosyltransferase [Myxococcota bacterium]|nr:ATP phosphoribosyltransferase [Myxococcota bacterium]
MFIGENRHSLKLGLPKGRMHEGIVKLMEDAGILLKGTERGYRPSINFPDTEVKILKPQNVVEMLDVGSRDLGFAGYDWVCELQVDLVEILDTGMDPVRVVAAAPHDILVDGHLPNQELLIASEYQTLTEKWIAEEGLNARFVRSYGATEVFPPEDADCIVDNTATGATLGANNLAIVHEVMRSSTRLFANRRAYENPKKRALIDQFAMLLGSAIEGRRRVMVEVNVANEFLDAVVDAMPCMRGATVSHLRDNSGFAVKAAVPRAILPEVIPKIKSLGGTDIAVSRISQLIP